MRISIPCLLIGIFVVAPTYFVLPSSTHPKTAHPSLQFDKTNRSPCTKALVQNAVCNAANRQALDIMKQGGLEAITVVQNVQTGALVVYAASQPQKLDITTVIAPLSLSKLLLSASWWDNQQPDVSFEVIRGTPNSQNPADRSQVSIHEMLVGGSDSAGRQMAVALRKAVGLKTIREDLNRYGFGEKTNSPRDDSFWREPPPALSKLTLPPAYASLPDTMSDVDLAETLSLGESNIGVTALHISRFLQAVGNKGIMIRPTAKEEMSSYPDRKPPVSHREANSGFRIMKETTALRLQSGMKDAVQRGTAKSIANGLAGTGWQIGGKTGSGTALLPKGSDIDGWFAGLIFDPQGKARFTVATFVRQGGYGGGKAAKISVEMARYLIGEKSTS